MRRLAAAILAAPVIASIYVAALLAMPGARRSLAAIGATMLVAIVGIGLIAPPPAASIPPSTPNPVAADLLIPVETGVAATPTPAASANPTPLAVTVKSPTRTTTNGTGGTGAPVAVVVGDTSTATQKPAAVNHVAPAAATVPVRHATTARITGSQPTGNRIRPTSGITLRFDRPVTLKAVRAALAIKPVVKGTLKALNTKVYTFTPAAALPANTAYTVSLTKPIRDSNGVAVAAPKPIHLLTAAAPTLLRFRPSKGTAQVDPTQVISVRFTAPMNHVTTQKAFSVVVAGHKVAGKVTWAENDSVLIFTPLKALAKGSGVGVRVLGTATSTDGVPLKKGGSATFKVVPAPAPKPTATAATPKAKPVTHKSTGSTPLDPRTGGSSLGGGSWAAAESYYLTLMNCTRTGGNVTSSGGCDSPGGRDVAPLWIDPQISANVSRPYAKYLAETGICSHFADGNPGTRLRRAGFDSYKWAENISCPKDMDPMALMVYTQQYFQAERSYGGGHYVNLMNALYDRVGIGVWVANGRAEVVIDFYHP